MKKYETYKESGVDWIGKIPEDWEVSKLKYNAAISFSSVDRHQHETEIKVSICHYPDAYKNEVINENTHLSEGSCTQSEFDKYQLKKGQVIITKDSESANDIGIPSYVSQTLENAVCGYHLAILDSNREVLKGKFILRYLQTNIVKTYFELNSNGVTRFGLGKPTIMNLSIPIIPMETQIKIIDYIDYKTKLIDTLTTKKEQLLKKLQAQRQAIINEAVTKGINKNAKLKDSGIEWLGEIPEHWEVLKFRHRFNTTKGLTITKANLLDRGIPCVNYGEIHSKFGFEVNPSIHNLKCVSENYLETNEGSLLKKGDFIFADTSEDIEGSGNFTYLNSDIPTFAGYHTIIARIIEPAHKRFFAYFFDSIVFRSQVQNAVKGVKVYSITNKILKDTSLFFPPIEEQIKITSFLDEQINNISNSDNKLKESIKKLKTYRQSIISEAVTGKIDVRDWQVVS